MSKSPTPTPGGTAPATVALAARASSGAEFARQLTALEGRAAAADLAAQLATEALRPDADLPTAIARLLAETCAASASVAERQEALDAVKRVAADAAGRLREADARAAALRAELQRLDVALTDELKAKREELRAAVKAAGGGWLGGGGGGGGGEEGEGEERAADGA